MHGKKGKMAPGGVRTKPIALTFLGVGLEVWNGHFSGAESVIACWAMPEEKLLFSYFGQRAIISISRCAAAISLGLDTLNFFGIKELRQKKSRLSALWLEGHAGM